MATFTESLVAYLRTLGIANVEFYAESSPAPKELLPHIVVISSQSENGGDLNRIQRTETKRFLVSGEAAACIAKAQEILNKLVPETDEVAGFFAEDYAVYTTFFEKRPSLAASSGNIFFADFIVRFLIAKD